jgi:two-component system cell cycle sensor histidine kinase/response regulator CckA
MTPIEILIVEDESIVAWDVSNRLQQLGYKVLGIATSGREAIAKALETDPDLILMDIKLKGEMDGVEAVQQIQAKLDIPAIYLTAYADEATLQRAKVTGPHGYLLKPLEDRELHSTIEMALYRHNLDRQLKESERWLNTTLNSIDDAVIATDARGSVKFMNPTAERLTGWSAQEAMGQSVTKIVELIEEDGGHPVDNPAEVILRTGTALKRTGHLLVSRNSADIPIDYSAAPIRNNKHDIIGMVITFQDISQKRAVQARIEKQERLAAVGQLAGGIAHEFNNILTGIIGFAELAGSHLNDPKRIGNDLQYVVEQGQRAAHLVRQMLDFSCKSFIQIQTMAVVEFFQDTVSLLKHTIPERITVTVTIEPGCEGFVIEVDPAQIRQALANLVANGVEAMPHGGTLGFQLSCAALGPVKPIHLPNLELNQRQTEPDLMIALSISDTGSGIRPEDYTHIFEPFFTTKEIGQGAGLGLSQVYGIVKQHGGEIEIDSEAGHGTTCTVYLPVKPLTRKPAPEIGGNLPRGNGELLWLIEDDPATKDATRAALEYLGYQVLVASNRSKALECGKQEEIVLILVDVTSPELGGIALARTLLKSRPSVQIIALTNYLPDNFDQALPADRASWLSKPWKLEKLAQTVSAALARTRQKRVI